MFLLPEVTGLSPTKLNIVLVLAILVTLLSAYGLYKSDVSPPDHVCYLDEEGVEKLVVMHNLSTYLTDDQVDSVSDHMSSSLQDILEEILLGADGPGGSGGANILCEYSCDSCSEDGDGDGSSGLNYVCCNGEVVDDLSECDDNSAACCEEPACVLETGTCSDTEGTCCPGLECVDYECVKPEEPCAEDEEACSTDDDCCEFSYCGDNDECVPCVCSETDSDELGIPNTLEIGTTTGWWAATGSCVEKTDKCEDGVLTEYYCGTDGKTIKTVTGSCGGDDCVGTGGDDYCDYTADPNGQSDCCEGYVCEYYMGDQGTCVPEEQCTSAENQCTYVGGGSQSDCCNGLTCEYDVALGGVCCYEEGAGTCTSDSECCFGNSCVDGVCTYVPPECVPVSGTCVFTGTGYQSNCCSDMVCEYYSGSDGTCKYEQGGPCNDSSECAYGNQCTNGICG